MNIQVLSRRRFEEYANKNHNIPSIVISIHSIGENPVSLTANQAQNAMILNILSIEADDVDIVERGGLNSQQAYQISNFVKILYHPSIKIIVHCGAGQSRSAGVAAAILKYYTNDDSLIFKSPAYTPNMLFYRQTLNALFLT